MRPARTEDRGRGYGHGVRLQAPPRRAMFYEVSEERRRGRSRGQWLALAAIVLLALLCILFLVTVEIVRRSEYLRDRVVDEVTQITGLPATAGDVDVLWGGVTKIHDVTLRLPVADEPVLETPVMTIHHGSLMSVILTRDVKITAIDIAQPQVFATERDGEWTVVEAVERIVAHVQGRPDDGQDDAPPDLPRITAQGGQVIVAPEDQERLSLPLDVVCEGVPLRYTVDATVGESRARLALALGGDWRHEVNAALAPSRELWAVLAEEAGLRPSDEPAGVELPPEAAISWEGRAAAAGLAGDLRIDKARYGGVTLAGSARAQRTEAGVAFDIDELTARRGEQRLEITGGKLRLEGSAFAVQRAQFAAGRGQDDLVGGAIEGSADLDRRSGEVMVRFFGGWPAGTIEHEGTLRAQVISPGGFPEVRAELDASGRAADTEIDIDATLAATGRGWNDMLGQLDITTLEVRRGGDTWQTGEVEIEGLLLEDRLTLTWFDAAAAERSVASGNLNLESLAWELDLEAGGWSIGPMMQRATIGIDASGQAMAIESWRAALETGEISALASGAYRPDDPEPVVASVMIATGSARPGEREQSVALRAARAARAADDPPERGLERLLHIDRNASLNMELRGTLDPLQLAGVSVLRAQPVAFDVPAEELTLGGRAELAGGELRVTSEEFAAFDGVCTLRIGATRREGLVLTVDCEDLSLASLATFAQIGTTLDGRAAANLRARWPRQDQSEMVVDGMWEAKDLVVGPLQADGGKGMIEIAEGDVRLRQVLLSRGEGRLRGSLDADLETWQQVWVDLESEGYQVGLAEFEAAITGDVEGSLDLSQQTGSMAGRVSAEISRGENFLGQIEAEAAVDGRLLTVEEFTGRVAGGAIRGWATVPLDEWTASQGALRLEDVHPARLAPELEQAQGALTGVIVAEPADNPHAHAPLRIAGHFTLEQGSLRGLTVGNVELEAYIGRERAVLDRGYVEIAGGTLEVWASTNNHDGDRYIQASGEIDDMDLNLLVHAVAPDAERYPGRISASFGGAGYVGALDRMFGEAIVEVRNADLLNLPVIAELHEVLALGGTGRGEGDAVVRLEGKALRIPEAAYFNGGTEVRLSLHMANVWMGAESPIAGGAVAWLRPLEASPLPFTDILDRLLAGVQAGGTSVRITGTAGDPETREVPLQELQSLLGRALGAGE